MGGVVFVGRVAGFSGTANQGILIPNAGKVNHGTPSNRVLSKHGDIVIKKINGDGTKNRCWLFWGKRACRFFGVIWFTAPWLGGGKPFGGYFF